LFIHIGTHKTGTKSIQNFLRTHASSLRKCGILVPTAGTLSPVSGHHNIAWQVRKDPRYRIRVGGIDELIAELKYSETSTGVISSEDFEYLLQYPHELRAFDERLTTAGFATKYLVYFREIEGYARSLFCELESTNGPMDYRVFRQSIQDEGSVCINDDWYYEFRHGLFIEKWEAIVGPKLHQCSYDEAIRGLGLLPSFLMMIGAPNAIFHESLDAPRFNTMFDKYQQLALELTAIKGSMSWRLSAPLRSMAGYCKRILRRPTRHLNKREGLHATGNQRDGSV
jgi:hypothetical protein